jgi:hypothetical protein
MKDDSQERWTMGLKRWMAAALVSVAASTASAQVLTEGFEDVGALGAAGWVQISNGSVAGDGWFQGNDGIFDAADGPTNSYAAANWVSSSGSISDWLMSPVLALPGGGAVDFALRLLGEGFLDRVEIYTSNAGASTDTASFTLLASYGARNDTNWLSLSLALPAMDGRIGFRYVVANTETAGNYVGLDSVSVVPEPASALLMALGGAALLWRRRAAR